MPFSLRWKLLRISTHRCVMFRLQQNSWFGFALVPELCRFTTGRLHVFSLVKSTSDSVRAEL